MISYGALAKNFCHAKWILADLRGWASGSLSESVKKGKFVTKIFFQIVLNKFLKTCDK